MEPQLTRRNDLGRVKLGARRFFPLRDARSFYPRRVWRILGLCCLRGSTTYWGRTLAEGKGMRRESHMFSKTENLLQRCWEIPPNFVYISLFAFENWELCLDLLYFAFKSLYLIFKTLLSMYRWFSAKTHFIFTTYKESSYYILK